MKTKVRFLVLVLMLAGAVSIVYFHEKNKVSRISRLYDDGLVSKDEWVGAQVEFEVLVGFSILVSLSLCLGLVFIDRKKEFGFFTAKPPSVDE